VTFSIKDNVYVIPVANCLKVCIDKQTIAIPMTKEDYGNFAWEVMQRWRESSDEVRAEDIKIYEKLR
tara:strand:- start:266 stop:466 length:201 start_codon:yes stop_codon:yes gene_type:complete